MIDASKRQAIFNMVVTELSTTMFVHDIVHDIDSIDEEFEPALDIVTSISNHMISAGLTVGEIPVNEIRARVMLAIRQVDASPVECLCSTCGHYHDKEGCLGEESPVMTLSLEGESYTYTQDDWDAATDYIYNIGLKPREDVHYVGLLAQLLFFSRVPGSEFRYKLSKEVQGVEGPYATAGACSVCGRNHPVPWDERKNPEAWDALARAKGALARVRDERNGLA